MLKIDWGDVQPSGPQKSAVEARLARAGAGSVRLRRHGMGYEARLRLAVGEHATELRLHDHDVGSAVERLVSLLEIVAHERTRLAH